MQVLSDMTTAFEINQGTDKLKDFYMCVYDYSDYENRDFVFANIRQFMSYHYPTAHLLIDGKFHYDIPLNWNILTAEPEEGECVLTSLDMLLHRQMYTPLFNPFFSSCGKLVSVEITKVNPINVEHFVPRIAPKSIALLPVGNRKSDCAESINFKTQEKIYYPLCIMGVDNSVTGKCNLDFYSDLLN